MGFTHIGKIIKHKGLKGDLVIRTNANFSIDKKKINSILIDFENNLLPFKLEKFSKIDYNHFLIKIKNNYNRDINAGFIGSKVYLKSEIINNEDSKIEKIIGFNIIENKKNIGIIMDYHTGKQLILFCEINNKEVLIPYNEHFIEKIDFANKKIFVNLPEGLVDLN